MTEPIKPATAERLCAGACGRQIDTSHKWCRECAAWLGLDQSTPAPLWWRQYDRPRPEVTDQTKPDERPGVCRHGGLRRQCEPCDYIEQLDEQAREIEALKAEVERLREWIKAEGDRGWVCTYAILRTPCATGRCCEKRRAKIRGEQS